jgi:hypothetical protein
VEGDDLPAVRNIPSKGYGSLPYCDAEHNPNLVRIYIDSQHDYLHDRIYLLGARVVACENGAVVRSRNIVHMSAQPAGEIGQNAETPSAESQNTATSSTQSDDEATLFLNWSSELLKTIAELAAPDETATRKRRFISSSGMAPNSKCCWKAWAVTPPRFWPPRRSMIS